MNAKPVLRTIILMSLLCIAIVCEQVRARPNRSKSGPSLNIKGTENELFSRIYGCEAAGAIANSMGDVTEGMSWRQIEQRYGLVDELLAQDEKGSRRPQRFGPDWVRHGHHRPPGMTEDGFERHRLCTGAIQL